MRASGILWTLITNAVLLFGVCLTAAPYIYMIAATFEPNSEIWSWPLTFYPKTLTNPDLYPGEVTTILGFIPLYLENYRYLFQELPFWRWMFNSLFMATTRSLLTIFLSSLAGFAFAKYNFKLRKIGFLIVLVSIMLPFRMLLILLFMEMAALKWLDTYWAIIVLFAASPFFFFHAPVHAGRAQRAVGCSPN